MPIYTNYKILWVIISILVLGLIPYPIYKKQLFPCAPNYPNKTERPNSKIPRDRSVIDGQTPCQSQRSGWVWRPPLIIMLYRKLELLITSDIPVKVEQEVPQSDSLDSESGTNNSPSPITSPLPFSCPKTEWLNCMPGPDKPNNYMQTFCSTEYLQWAKKNCPGFKGAAY